MRGVGRAMFAAVLLLIAGTLNVIYGIAGIGDAHWYANGAHYVFSGLNTWGWFTLIIGIVQLTAGVSLFGGGTYGRVIGIAAASLGAINSLLAVQGPNPWWALGVFAVCLVIIHGLIVFGDEPAASSRPGGTV